jgi:capsular polysaccharide biosynthesis protein
MYKNVLEIDVFRCIKALFKRWGFISIITILFFAAGMGLTLDVGEDQYSASATVYAAADRSYTEAANAVTAMNAYLDVAKSYKVSKRAALIMGRSDVDAAKIQSSVWAGSSVKQGSSNTVSSFMNSSATIITIVATTTDPDLSVAMANAVAESYTIEMADIIKTDAVKNLDNASSAYLSYNAIVEAWKNRIKVMLVGFVLACILVVACEIFDSKVRTVREATIRNELPIIGVIPDYKD